MDPENDNDFYDSPLMMGNSKSDEIVFFIQITIEIESFFDFKRKLVEEYGKLVRYFDYRKIRKN